MFIYMYLLFAYYLFVDFWPAILCGLIATIALVVICLSIPRKKRKLIGVSAVVMVLCSVGAITWCVLFPREYPYVDLWVLGKTEEQIIEVYGEPDYNEYKELAYKTNWEFFDMNYYVIEFDENDRAYKIWEGPYVGPGG